MRLGRGGGWEDCNAEGWSSRGLLGGFAFYGRGMCGCVLTQDGRLGVRCADSDLLLQASGHGSGIAFFLFFGNAGRGWIRWEFQERRGYVFMGGLEWALLGVHALCFMEGRGQETL